MTSVLVRRSFSFSLSLTYMYTHTLWLPYSPLSLKTCNCSTINDIKHFPQMHEFKSALLPSSTLPKTQILICTNIRFMFSEHSQQEVVIDTSKIKTLPRPFSIHVFVCVNCRLFSCFFCGHAQSLAIQLQCEFLCEKGRKKKR